MKRALIFGLFGLSLAACTPAELQKLESAAPKIPGAACTVAKTLSPNEYVRFFCTIWGAVAGGLTGGPDEDVTRKAPVGPVRIEVDVPREQAGAFAREHRP